MENVPGQIRDSRRLIWITYVPDLPAGSPENDRVAELTEVADCGTTVSPLMGRMVVPRRVTTDSE